MRRYVGKPQEVEAVQWTGHNLAVLDDDAVPFVFDHDGHLLYLRTGKDGAQGHTFVPVGHWIVRNPGDHSDYWPVAPDYFARKYQPLEPTP